MLLMAWSNDDTRYKDKLQQYSYCICDNSACSDIILYCIAYAGVICLYCHFVIFLLVLISFPTAKSFVQLKFTPKNFFAPSGHQILHFSLKNWANPTFFFLTIGEILHFIFSPKNFLAPSGHKISYKPYIFSY